MGLKREFVGLEFMRFDQKKTLNWLPSETEL